MRRPLTLIVVLALLLAAGSASAQWHFGLRLCGTGNYFPYMPGLGDPDDPDPMPLADTGIFGYKEFAVGYGDAFQVEANFAYSTLSQTVEFPEEFGDMDDAEGDLTWWYVGGAVFYRFLEGENYNMSAGLRYQYGASELHSKGPEEDLEGQIIDFTYTGSTSQFSVPLRFTLMAFDGHFGFGPEVAFKYTMGSTETDMTVGGEAVDEFFPEPEYNGWDTEFSLNLQWFF